MSHGCFIFESFQLATGDKLNMNQYKIIHPIRMPFPQWQGESLAGKSLLVWPEQGLGDEIQFCRYLPLLKEQGASRITLICKPSLKPLMETLEGVDAVIGFDESDSVVDTHDYWTAATSHLPYLLSSALVLTTPSDARQLSGPGFRSMTRLAATPSSMMLDVLETNRDYILNALEQFREQIELIETLLKHSDRNQLELFLSDSAAHKKEMG